MQHSELGGSGRVPHHLLDSAIDPGGEGYALNDVLALESSLTAPATGTAPSRAAYDTVFSLWQFPDNVTRHLQSSVQLPHGYVPDTPLLWHVHFIPGSTIEQGQTVIFSAEVSFGSVGAAMSARQTVTSTFTAAASTVAGVHCITRSVAITPPELGGSGFILARITRDTADTFTGGVFLLGSDYHVRLNRLGSATENPYL